ncbi:MAG: iron chelate uptake ABC transporter family permease subunit [Microbacterium sp.]|uniref:FecCD family ABC transporter permease n=1 Tax=Microbacterium sp. TaxID=51671 RepID=UPI0039E4DB3B
MTGRAGARTADRPAPLARHVRWRRTVAIRIRVRRLLVNATLAGVALAAAAITLGIGDYPVSPLAAVQTLLGQGTHAQWTVVVEWRMPVLIAAMSFGALLGVSGGVFQSLTRNPLGSPDVIGFDAGSYTAVVTVVLLVGATGYWAIAAAAITGGLLTAVVVYVLAYRRGVQGFRLIIVGIAVSAVLGAINSYLITRADVNDAIAVGFWGAGTLAGVRWENLGPSLLLGGAVLIALAALSRELHQLELGDDAAVTQGVHAGRARVLLLLCGVAATAVVTAAAGPIAFIALSAPQIGRRLAHDAGMSLTSAAFAGAALLSLAQLLSAALSAWHTSIPVGLITVCLGGLYLIWLLIRESRRTV